MRKTTDSNSTNQNSEVELDEDHKLTVTESAQLLGNNVAKKATETKDSVVDTLNEVKESAIDKANASKETVIEKTNDARSVTAAKIGSLKDSIEPPKPEPETKTISDRLVDASSTIMEQVKECTSNIHLHPDEQSKLDNMKLEEKKEENTAQPIGQAVIDSAQSAKSNVEQLSEDAKVELHEKADAARSWTADKLGQLQTTIEPPLKEEGNQDAK